MKILLGAGGGALLASAAVLWAQPPGGGPLERFDADGNGQLTLAEVQRGIATMFADADADKNGALTAQEMRAHHEKMGMHGARRGPRAGPRGQGPRVGPMHLDSNGDGNVSLAEAQAELARHFAQLDADKDGSVTRAEAEAAHRAMMGRH
ncbi:MAG TPA: hypothetical protein VHM92_01730 [Allosphingosinicella sp.]|nr:hypothetical protein [Allosphingosinicella sp.]